MHGIIGEKESQSNPSCKDCKFIYISFEYIFWNYNLYIFTIFISLKGRNINTAESLFIDGGD